MTKQNYTHISNQTLIELVYSLNLNPHSAIQKLKSHYPELMNEIIKRTSFIAENKTTIPLAERLYCIEHNLSSIPLCENPNCPTHSSVGWNLRTKTFLHYCSVKCAMTDKIVQQKLRETFIKKYGVENPAQSKQIQDKIKQTNIRRFGVDNAAKSIEVKRKTIETNRKKYNVDYPMQTKEIQNRFKQSMLDTWGVEWSGQSQELYEKTKTTTLNKYGVEHYAQSIEYHKKCRKPYISPKYPDMTFATSWEFKVYDFLTEHIIPFEYQPAISIPYEYKGTHHTYHPDFKVGDKIVEVKGDNFFRINEKTGQEEMYKPWRSPNLSDEEYEWQCGKEEAKHQCMLKNNVIILRQKNIQNLSLDTFGLQSNQSIV